jgi:hypothetical protein
MMDPTVKPARFAEGRMLYNAPTEETSAKDQAPPSPGGKPAGGPKPPEDKKPEDAEEPEALSKPPELVPAIALPAARALRAGTATQAANSKIATGKDIDPEDAARLSKMSIAERLAQAEARSKAKTQSKPDPKDAVAAEAAAGHKAAAPPVKRGMAGGGPAPRLTYQEYLAKLEGESQPTTKTGSSVDDGTAGKGQVGSEQTEEKKGRKKRDFGTPQFMTFDRPNTDATKKKEEVPDVK